MNKAKKENIEVEEPKKFNSVTGKGIEAVYKNRRILLGNRRLMEDNKIYINNMEDSMSKLEGQGKTAMLAAYDKKLIGVIAVADTLKKIKQNLFWAFVYNTLGIPVAAGVLYPFTGFLLNPIIAGIAMSLSSVSVVMNTLLMKRYKPSL